MEVKCGMWSEVLGVEVKRGMWSEVLGVVCGLKCWV